MGNRSLLFLFLLLLCVFLAIRFELPMKAKIGVMNMIYGDEIRGIGGFLVVAEVRSLPDELWRKTPGRPSLTLSVHAVRQTGGIYQYTVTIEAAMSEAGGALPGAEKSKTLWSTYKMGEGDVSDMREKTAEITDLFLKARSAG